MASDQEKTRVMGKPVAAGGRRPGGSRAAPAPEPNGKIVFFCPNGHRVVADAAQAGRKGRCSSCREPVTIPASSQPAAPPVSTRPAGSGPPPAAAGGEPSAPANAPPPPHPADAGAAESAAAQENWDFIVEEGGGGYAGPGWPAAAGGLLGDEMNPTAQLVARLWGERDHGGIIELHLAGGSVILPEWYDANWSRGTHGLFASPAADGSVTITAVAWDTVQKVVVRQLGEVPEDMFT